MATMVYGRLIYSNGVYKPPNITGGAPPWRLTKNGLEFTMTIWTYHWPHHRRKTSFLGWLSMRIYLKVGWLADLTSFGSRLREQLGGSTLYIWPIWIWKSWFPTDIRRFSQQNGLFCWFISHRSHCFCSSTFTHGQEEQRRQQEENRLRRRIFSQQWPMAC